MKLIGISPDKLMPSRMAIYVYHWVKARDMTPMDNGKWKMENETSQAILNDPFTILHCLAAWLLTTGGPTHLNS
jgi:hypothetical protein